MMLSPLERFIRILVITLPKEEITRLLQAITDEITLGFCDLCGEEEIPVDNLGNRIEGDDVSMASEWCEQHTQECPVTLLEYHQRKKQ